MLAYKWAYLAWAKGEDGLEEVLNDLRKSMTPSALAEAERLIRNFEPR